MQINAALFALVAILSASFVRSTAADESKFLRYMEYAEEIREVTQAYQQHVKRGEALLEERDTTLRQIAKTDNEVRKLSALSEWKKYLLFEADLFTAAATYDALQQFNGGTPSGMISLPVGTPRLMRRSLENPVRRAERAQLQETVLEYQVRVADAAGQMTLQTRIRLVQSLQQTVREMREWSKKNEELVDSFLNLADVNSIRCEIELRSALRELEKIAAFPLATYLQGITLLRLGRLDEADMKLKSLETIAPLRALSIAAQSEILFSRSADKQAMKLVQEASKLGDTSGRVKMCVAIALQRGHEFDKSVEAWQAALKLGAEQTQAHAAIARLAAMHPKLNAKRRAVASENAALACKLSARKAWNCELTLALAETVNGNQLKAIEASDRARELAIGSKRLLCESVRDAITQNSPIPWKF